MALLCDPSASAAAFTAILAKIGVEGVPSTLATAIRTVIVLVFVWLMVLGFHEQRPSAPSRGDRSCSSSYRPWHPAFRGWPTSVPYRSALHRESPRSTSSVCH